MQFQSGPVVRDLTRPLHPGSPVYPGDPPVRFREHAAYISHGYRVTEVTLGTHAGTHLDAPSHFLAHGGGVEALSLAALIGLARVVDIEGPVGEIAAGERLLLRSGWSARWGEPEYFESFPGLSTPLAERLAAAPAALIGLETPSLHPDSNTDARLHRLLLNAGVVVVENLVGLAELPEQIFLAALPLPLQGLDGSPCRVVALLERDR